jgi:hypothetical protein
VAKPGKFSLSGKALELAAAQFVSGKLIAARRDVKGRHFRETRTVRIIEWERNA